MLLMLRTFLKICYKLWLYINSAFSVTFKRFTIHTLFAWFSSGKWHNNMLYYYFKILKNVVSKKVVNNNYDITKFDV